ncbi:DgyrCDS11807 [Dimorphilus gyrociliatus]|uniref:DgyrCDS11807 n=1 Tax=Dimorphilus gyrociliatus TaxID=2664684 RepID=A0A7I8W5H0_9ANNE|nr:DgyrCDS11807 [Dimorphilus gyrociliatus]
MNSKSVRYKQIPLADEDESAIQFHSSFSYASIMDYSSAFKYSSQNTPVADDEEPSKSYGMILYICSKIILVFSIAIIIVTMPISLLFTLRTVRENENLVVFRLGRYYKTYKPGIRFRIPWLDKCTRVQMQQKAFSIPPQKLLTQDGAALQVGADVFYRISQPVQYISSVKDLNHSLRELSHSILCSELSQRYLSDIESNKNEVVNATRNSIMKFSQDWGVTVERVELGDILVVEGSKNPLSQISPSLQAIGSILLPPGATRPTQVLGSSKPAEKVEQEENIDSLIGKIRNILDKELVREISAIYSFSIAQEDTNTTLNYFLDLKNGTGSIGEGSIKSPDVTFTLTSNTLKKLLDGEGSAFDAYMNGELGVEGSLLQARKLDTLVDRYKNKVCIA